MLRSSPVTDDIFNEWNKGQEFNLLYVKGGGTGVGGGGGLVR